jgi:hypothetical protein
MRSKEELLKEQHNKGLASEYVQRRLLLEVLIDIRDLLSTNTKGQ